MNEQQQESDELVLSTRVADHYVNQVGISVSPFDVALTWGRRFPDGSLEPLVRTTMSVEHAVSTYALMGRLLRRHFSEGDMKAALSEKVLSELGIMEEELPW